MSKQGHKPHECCTCSKFGHLVAKKGKNWRTRKVCGELMNARKLRRPIFMQVGKAEIPAALIRDAPNFRF